jgi:hypothetical protein
MERLGSFFITGISDLQGTSPQAPMRRLAKTIQRRQLSDADLAALKLGFRFSGIDGTAASYAVMAGELFAPDPPLPPFNVTGGPGGALCPNAVITSRNPTAQDTSTPAPQVCTAFRVEPVDPTTFQVNSHDCIQRIAWNDSFDSQITSRACKRN